MKRKFAECPRLSYKQQELWISGLDY